MRAVAVDTETHLIQPGLAAPPLVCLSWHDGQRSGLLRRDEALEWYARQLADADVLLVGCNVVYDLGVLCAARPELTEATFAAVEAGRISSIDIREALMDIARGELSDEDDGTGRRYSLALLVARHLGKDISADKGADGWRLRYAQLEPLPLAEWPMEAVDYPLRDARYTFDVWQAQAKASALVDICRQNLTDEPRQVRAAWALRLTSMWGLRVSRERYGALKASVDAEHARARGEFSRHGIYRPNGTKDTKKLGELVSAAYGGKPPIAPTGKVATDRDTLLESGDPVLVALGKSGRNDKLRSTYLPMLERGLDAPWNPSFNVLVATGRVSSDAQQFPQAGGIRECFEPRPGHVFCSVDYGGLELRTMSQRAIWTVGFSRMAEALNRGQDVHTLAAASFLSVSYEELLPKVKAKEKQATSYRALAKVFNFGKGGGLGAGGMAFNAREKDGVRFCLLLGRASQCGTRTVDVFAKGKSKKVCAVCVAVAKELGDAWLEAWPEQAELFAMAGRLTQGDTTVAVEVPGSRRVRGACRYTQWLNTPFQGLGGDLAKDATWRVSREMYVDRKSPLYGSRLVLMVHDELIAELPEERAPEAAERMAHLMREAAREWLPDLGPSIEAEPAISRILSKSMATVRDAAGRLQLWEAKP